ncbi:hypothetical protein B0H67DRAFT_591652 [Lasiosphaeris hirsuta]|uniref:Uncharacterized protein n=1 Tax=Lasiosphaeris hirsuta TaxID=260670 RepID=A0AA39ZVX6_9PEZI|nr:hypothetical protein B0H67DRAFT_591652 [Lasiosphaeris hirsuta]
MGSSARYSMGQTTVYGQPCRDLRQSTSIPFSSEISYANSSTVLAQLHLSQFNSTLLQQHPTEIGMWETPPTGPSPDSQGIPIPDAVVWGGTLCPYLSPGEVATSTGPSPDCPSRSGDADVWAGATPYPSHGTASSSRLNTKQNTSGAMVTSSFRYI